MRNIITVSRTTIGIRQRQLLTVALFLIAVSPAAADQALASANTCMACHSATSTLVGPSFRDIAKRYKSTPDASALLAGRIMKGSSGNWGAIPMPGQTQLNAADARRLARWVLDSE